ncbi:hypothetical protein L873DRAFT_704139 [Choiromyces venosus 120613-1]|uniref:BTB domain-containing protein n=1 Tax=Choiromyces venosus 120613-1 TaxID=1336337 RepID=A0A3N4IWN2_9PEZI|nr:hypothetical protein L873DRAFT_704139 [Choiromyces venosus 120613-1]
MVYSDDSSVADSDDSSVAQSPTSKYKEFIFAGTVTLYVGPHRKKMEIHKKLLADISPELNKLINNDMKEGIEGIIRLPEEGEDMLSLFTEWAYTGEYEMMQPPKQRNIWSVPRMHLELYVFSDKFNIPTLRELVKAKLYIEICFISVEDDDHVLDLISILEYAYDNLSDWDPVCLYLARYSASKLKVLRSRDEFIEFASNQPEFMKEFLENLTSSSTGPSPL